MTFFKTWNANHATQSKCTEPDSLHVCTHPPLTPILSYFCGLLCSSVKIRGLVPYRVNQEFPTKHMLPREKNIYIYTHKVDTIASRLRSVVQFAPGCPLMREPGLPSAPVWSGFPRRSRVSRGWEAMCRSWARTKGLGVMTSQATQAAF